jgi:hypothetical protein
LNDNPGPLSKVGRVQNNERRKEGRKEGKKERKKERLLWLSTGVETLRYAKRSS